MAHDTKDLTPRQRQILDFIRRTVKAKGVPPSIREIGQAVQLRSSSTVHLHLKTLEKLGYLARDATLSRSIKVKEGKRPVAKAADSTLPLVKAIVPAEEILDESNVESRMTVPFTFEEDGPIFLTFLLGETLRDIGILPGDLIAVRVKSEASPGEIVVAIVDGTSTAMRYFPASGSVRLEPENRRMRPIFVRSATIVGVVAAVFRKL
jgi:repressor LexA